MANTRLQPCVRCLHESPVIKDCGYTTFNPYWIECPECGLSSSDNRPTQYSISVVVDRWNSDWDDAKAREELNCLRQENAAMKWAITHALGYTRDIQRHCKVMADERKILPYQMATAIGGLAGVLTKAKERDTL